MTGWDIAQQFVNGLSLASIYALVAVGITLVFGLTGLLNFAHGEIMMLGSFVLLVIAPDGGAIFALGLLAAILVVALVSFLLERGLFQFTVKVPINGFLVSLGLIFILQNLLIAQFTISPAIIEPPFTSILEIGGLRIAWQRLFVIAFAVLTLLALFWVMTRTKLGLAMRASAIDSETAGLMGIAVPSLITVVFVVGGILAAIAGALIATISPITPVLGANFIAKGFAVALMGGLGNVMGALIAAFILGIGEAMLAGFGFGAWVDMLSFGLLIAILMVRPQGVLRGSEGKI